MGLDMNDVHKGIDIFYNIDKCLGKIGISCCFSDIINWIVKKVMPENAGKLEKIGANVCSRAVGAVLGWKIGEEFEKYEEMQRQDAHDLADMLNEDVKKAKEQRRIRKAKHEWEAKREKEREASYYAEFD